MAEACSPRHAAATLLATNAWYRALVLQQHLPQHTSTSTTTTTTTTTYDNGPQQRHLLDRLQLFTRKPIIFATPGNHG